MQGGNWLIQTTAGCPVCDKKVPHSSNTSIYFKHLRTRWVRPSKNSKTHTGQICVRLNSDLLWHCKHVGSDNLVSWWFSGQVFSADWRPKAWWETWSMPFRTCHSNMMLHRHFWFFFFLLLNFEIFDWICQIWYLTDYCPWCLPVV